MYDVHWRFRVLCTVGGWQRRPAVIGCNAWLAGERCACSNAPCWDSSAAPRARAVLARLRSRPCSLVARAQRSSPQAGSCVGWPPKPRHTNAASRRVRSRVARRRPSRAARRRPSSAARRRSCRVACTRPVGLRTGGQEGLRAGGQAGAPRAQVFYAATQALLYVLCYRLPHIMELSHARAARAPGAPAGPPGAPAAGAGAPAPAAVAGPADVRALRQLLRAVMPELLGHRCCPGGGLTARPASVSAAALVTSLSPALVAGTGHVGAPMGHAWQCRWLACAWCARITPHVRHQAALCCIT